MVRYTNCSFPSQVLSTYPMPSTQETYIVRFMDKNIPAAESQTKSTYLEMELNDEYYFSLIGCAIRFLYCHSC